MSFVSGDNCGCVAMSEKGSGKWPAKVMNAVVVLLVTAVGARVAWELLAPLVPGLIVFVALGVIYSSVLGHWRR